MTETEIRGALSTVIDPDLEKDLVSLNMIQNLKIEGKEVSFSLVLTTPACPLKETLGRACEDAIRKVAGDEVIIKITYSSSRPQMPQRAMLTGVKNIIAVVSGKGGVGKSTVSSNLALALSQTGARVGLMDADIYGPSIPIMFGIEQSQPQAVQKDGKTMILPIEKMGIKMMSIGLLVDPDSALLWRGPVASGAIRQFLTDVEWGDLDYLVIDFPPGTGDIHLTIVQTVPITGAIVVSTPQKVALADARKAINMFVQPKVHVPLIGLVENMAYFTPEELPDNKYYLFGREGGKKLAEEFKIPFLGQIPLVQSIREGGDEGKPAMSGSDLISKKAFREFASAAIRSLARRNATMPETKVVEINR